MKISVKNGLMVIFDLLVLMTFFYLLVHPKYVSVPVTESIYLCVKVIIPALFVYMVLARLILSMPLTEMIHAKLGRYGIETEVLLLGVLCGFPVGAKSAMYLYENGMITKKRAEYLCSFTNNASLSFLLGYIGTVLFDNILIGLRLAIFQLCAAIITAIVFRFTFMSKNDFVSLKQAEVRRKKRTGFAEAVTDSAMTMLSVCAFIVLFSVLGEFALRIVHPDSFCSVLLKGFFEFSTGCTLAEKLSPQTAFTAVGVVIAFSGLCIMMQVISVMQNKLSPRMYLTGRILNAALVGLFSLFFGIS